MQVEEILSSFKSKPYLVGMGAGTLSKILKAKKEDVYIARRLYRNKKKNKKPVVTNLPKILLFDLEVAPLRAHIWRYWDQSITHPDQLLSDWFVLSWSAKWLFDTEVQGEVLVSAEVAEEDDSRIIKSLWKLVDEADIVIGHNSNRYDIPKLNSRFIINDLPPASSYKSIDTLMVARSTFGFSSNKLDDLARLFKMPVKLATGFSLWAKCMRGDQESLDYMLKYNKHDVNMLEEIYLKLRPYIKTHPNIAMYVDSTKSMCSCCGSEDLTKESKPYVTNTAKYDQFRCNECGGLTRGRKNLLTKEEKENLLTAIPR